LPDLAGLIGSGALLDVLLAGLVLEAAVLLALAQRSRRGIPARSLLATLLAGGLILCAWRLSVAGAWWGWVGLALAAALAAHIADLAQRWR
jgi:predicted GNAT superfamily acetyltransferase